MIASDYATSYAVVISRATAQDENWLAVANTLSQKHQNAPILIVDDLCAANEKLSALMPKYTCIVAKPEELNRETIFVIQRNLEKLDDDPYMDTLLSFITGYTVADAMRMAMATEPKLAKNVISTTSIGVDRFAETHFISDSQDGVFGKKNRDGTLEKHHLPDGDLTDKFIAMLNNANADMIITSAHASQRNLEMPFSRGNIICRDGKLFGKITDDGKRLIGDDGQAVKKEIAGEILPINEPQKPCVFFAPGNCLISDIPDKNCMMLAWSGWGKANQFIGYALTTWFGIAGWGATLIWESKAGEIPLNESVYFAQQNIIYQLNKHFPQVADYQIAVDKEPQLSKLTKDIREKIAFTKSEMFTLCAGLLWDKNALVMYGDPSFEIRHCKENTVPPKIKTSLTRNEKNQFVWDIEIVDTLPSEIKNSVPIADFLPVRIRHPQIISGAEFNPLITDNFIFLSDTDKFNAGDKLQIIFTGEECE